MREQGMLLIAVVSLFYKLQPEDLEIIANQLAEFDAVNDALTGEYYVSGN